MAETIKTCEEYVLNVLSQKEQELAKVVSELEEQKITTEYQKKQLDYIIELGREIAMNLNFEPSSNGDYLCVYLANHYVGLVDEKDPSPEERPLLALKELYEFIKSIPVREE